MSELNVDGFHGTVILRDWVRLRDGRQVTGFTGNVRIMQAEAAIGFAPARSESNWIARVEGSTESVTVLGCQVRGAFVHPVEADPPAGSGDYWIVP